MKIKQHSLKQLMDQRGNQKENKNVYIGRKIGNITYQKLWDTIRQFKREVYTNKYIHQEKDLKYTI